MKRYKLQEFLSKLGYEYSKDENYVRALCAMTKCRTSVTHNIGYESCFLFLALCEAFKPRKFLEFGTGRGTTSFLVGQRPTTEHVLTIDIVHPDTIRNTWFDYKTVCMSNNQIHTRLVDRLQGTNCPIERVCGDSVNLTLQNFNHNYDLVYIDGSHDYFPVKKDIELAKQVVAEDSIIVLDDYHPNYGVIHAVHEMLPNDELILVEVNGHIFGPPAEEGTGHIIWPRGKYKELLDESFSVR
jgi:predicted O-methyltransferase YrrM